MDTNYYNISEVISLLPKYLYLKMIVHNWQILSHEGGQVHFVLDGNQTHYFSGDKHLFHTILRPRWPTKKKGEFENTKGVIRCRSMGYRQHNGQINMDKKTNNDQQNPTQKTKDCETRTPLKTEVNSGAPDGLAVTALLVAPVVLLFLQTRK